MVCKFSDYCVSVGRTLGEVDQVPTSSVIYGKVAGMEDGKKSYSTRLSLEEVLLLDDERVSYLVLQER